CRRPTDCEGRRRTRCGDPDCGQKRVAACQSSPCARAAWLMRIPFAVELYFRLRAVEVSTRASTMGDSREDLLAQVRQKRGQIEKFVAKALPRKRRLLNITIIGGALAAVLTTGPAVGGQSFTAWLSKTFTLTSPAWQVLCAAAALCSVTATIATQILKS